MCSSNFFSMAFGPPKRMVSFASVPFCQGLTSSMAQPLSVIMAISPSNAKGYLILEKLVERRKDGELTIPHPILLNLREFVCRYD